MKEAFWSVWLGFEQRVDEKLPLESHLFVKAMRNSGGMHNLFYVSKARRWKDFFFRILVVTLKSDPSKSCLRLWEIKRTRTIDRNIKLDGSFGIFKVRKAALSNSTGSLARRAKDPIERLFYPAEQRLKGPLPPPPHKPPSRVRPFSLGGFKPPFKLPFVRRERAAPIIVRTPRA